MLFVCYSDVLPTIIGQSSIIETPGLIWLLLLLFLSALLLCLLCLQIKWNKIIAFFCLYIYILSINILLITDNNFVRPQPLLKSKMATWPRQKQMKWRVSCVTYEPKLRPTMQCHVGLYFLSNSFLMQAAMSCGQANI